MRVLTFNAMTNKGNFKKGHKPWNKDLKGIHLSQKTEFKKGQRTAEKVNTWKGGTQTNTNDCIYLYDGVGKRVRRPKKILENNGVVVPKGWIIYHLDKDKHNDDLTNLIPIPRAILIKLNNGSLNSNYYNITQEIENYLKQK